MKVVGIIIGLISFSSIYACELPHRKFIIHKDINKTIIAEDPAGDKSVDDILIQTLAEHYKYRWEEGIETPISYADYIKSYVLTGPKSDSNLKKLRNQKISEFINFLQTTHHPYHTAVRQRFEQLSQKLSHNKVNNQAMIFTSCYREIEYLQQNNIPFTYVLRTFGKDLDRIIAEMHQKISPHFFSWRGIFKDSKLELKSLTSDTILHFDTVIEIYNFLKTVQGNLAIQDDWNTWHRYDECAAFGKLFPIDIEDKTIVSLFADDNGHPKDGIINPRHPRTQEMIDIANLIETHHICVVDMLKAIEDDDYFIKHLQLLLENEKAHNVQ